MQARPGPSRPAFRHLDARLPGGGWPLSTLIELLVPAAGVGEIRLLLPALRTLATATPGEPRWIAWLAPPHLPYAPALADAGLDPARMLVIRPRAGLDWLWAMEQACDPAPAPPCSAGSARPAIRPCAA